MKSPDTSDHQTLWNASQCEALAALQLTYWQTRQNQQSETPVAATECYFYKLGAWLLELEERLPVAVPLWLSDLFFACTEDHAAKPAEVSASAADNWAPEQRLKLALVQPSAAQKRALWKQLSGAHAERR
ncbi:hypothetical protein CWI80_12080 [Pseudidiomarina sediminum]|uniref:Uncharacterized protein n=1 Tax=Pseudidiomarina sediminum TaxID=431675 RepID=A0A432YZP3_9GAMM|nr:hypothetical protein [Pseudidiomarina sediminum]MBY6065103.1 hypothetical protein [Pseudidiomarina sediminum]RUO69375.1 hypothetical protein CWI80_12080 [Pseudidiomarina sediminum]